MIPRRKSFDSMDSADMEDTIEQEPGTPETADTDHLELPESGLLTAPRQGAYETTPRSIPIRRLPSWDAGSGGERRNLLMSPGLAPVRLDPPTLVEPGEGGSRLMVAAAGAAAVAIPIACYILFVGPYPSAPKPAPASESIAVSASVPDLDQQAGVGHIRREDDKPAAISAPTPAPGALPGGDSAAQTLVPVREAMPAMPAQDTIPPMPAPTLPEVAALPAPRAPEPAVAGNPVRNLAPEGIRFLVQRGEQLLRSGDVAAARLAFVRAAEAGDQAAALAMGATYDPAALSQRGVRGVSGDAAKARYWYEKAEAFGSPEAARRLERLASRSPSRIAR